MAFISFRVATPILDGLPLKSGLNHDKQKDLPAVKLTGQLMFGVTSARRPEKAAGIFLNRVVTLNIGNTIATKPAIRQIIFSNRLIPVCFQAILRRACGLWFLPSSVGFPWPLA